MRLPACLLLLLSLLFSGAAPALPVQPDPTFNGFGFSTLPFPGGDEYVGGSATDAQGRLYIGVNGFQSPLSTQVVARLNLDGSLDPGFGVGGVASIGLIGERYDISGVAVDAFERILVVGNSVAEPTRNFIARLNSNGSLDVDFDGDGIRYLTGSEFAVGRLDLNAIQPVTVFPATQRILLIGSASSGGIERAAVVALTDTGAVVPGFGTGGISQLNTSEATLSRYYNAFYQQDEYLYAIGAMSRTLGDRTFLITRLLTATGQLDSAFANPGAAPGSRGYVTISFGLNSFAEAWDMEDTTGGLIVSGTTTVGGPTNAVVARLLRSASACATIYPGASTAGCLDPVFGQTGAGNPPGTRVLDLGGNESQLGTHYEVVPGTPDLIYVGHYVSGYRNGQNAVTRLTLNGQTDPSFGTGGVVEFANTEYFGVMHTRSVGSIPPALTLVGLRSPVPGPRDTLVLRVLADGSPDQSFSGDGEVRLDLMPQATASRALLRYPDGRILMAGTSGQGAVLARVLADGSPDPNFGGAGRVALPALGVEAQLAALALSTDGRIVALGTSRIAGGFQATLVRLLNDGSIDSSFGNQGIAFPPATRSSGEGLVIDASGRIVITGTRIELGADERGFLARFLANGTLDTSFAGTGSVDYGGLVGGEAAGRRVTLDGNRIIAAGTTGNIPARWIVLRLLDNGSFDASFGLLGRAILTPPNNAAGVLSALRVDAAGRVLFGGAAGTLPIVGRLLESGSLDSAFSGGYASFAGLITPGEIRAIELDTPDRILAAGVAGRHGNPLSQPNDAVIYRLFANGAGDLQFNLSGRRVLSLGAASTTINAMTVDPETRIVAAGENNQSMTAFRLTMRADSSSQLGSAPNPSSYGEPIVLGASVTGSPEGDGATPTGLFEFRRDDVLITSVPLQAPGQASFVVSDLPAGSYALGGRYLGDAVYAGSDAAGTQVVTRASTSVNLQSSSPSSVPYGEPVSLQASVSAAFGTQASGEVSIRDNEIELTRFALTGGQASGSLSTLLPGVHPLSAVYLGDSNHLPSAPSVPITQTITPAVATGSVQAQPNPVAVGQTVTLSSSWSGVIGAPTGNVSFRADGNLIAGCNAVALVNGSASCTISFAAAGARQISAQYSGSTNYLPGSVGPVELQVLSGTLFANGFE